MRPRRVQFPVRWALVAPCCSWIQCFAILNELEDEPCMHTILSTKWLVGLRGGAPLAHSAGVCKTTDRARKGTYVTWTCE